MYKEPLDFYCQLLQESVNILEKDVQHRSKITFSSNLNSGVQTPEVPLNL